MKLHSTTNAKQNVTKILQNFCFFSFRWCSRASPLSLFGYPKCVRKVHFEINITCIYLYGRRDANNKNNMPFGDLRFSQLCALVFTLLISLTFSLTLIIVPPPSHTTVRVYCWLELLRHPHTIYIDYLQSRRSGWCRALRIIVIIHWVNVVLLKWCKWCLLNTISCPFAHIQIYTNKILCMRVVAMDALFAFHAIRHDSYDPIYDKHVQAKSKINDILRSVCVCVFVWCGAWGSCML